MLCPMVKPTTFRLILAFALISNWKIRRLDVKNNFLHGHLYEIVYMEQLLGFINAKFPNHVYLLKWSLNGLKQAPRAKLDKLSTSFLTLGFLCSWADFSLCIYHRKSILILILIYVDDVIVTSSSPTLCKQLSIKCTIILYQRVPLYYFLSIEAQFFRGDFISFPSPLFAYLILQRENMHGSSNLSTSLATYQSLSQNDDD